MTSKRRLWAVVLSAAAVTGPALRPLRAHFDPSAPGNEQGPLEQLFGQLNTPRTPNEKPQTQADREEAARRIVKSYLPRRPSEIGPLLLAALGNQGNDGAQRAAAVGLAEDSRPDPDPAFVRPLLLLVGRNPNTSPPAALALARYKGRPDVLVELVRVARDRTVPESVRAGIVRALGSIVDQQAALQLIRLLRDDNNPNVQDAVMDALGQMTSLNFHRDAGEVEAWWARASQTAPLDWQREQEQRAASRAAELANEQEREADEERLQLSTIYRSTPEAQRSKLALQLLRSRSPTFRSIGAGLVREDTLENRQPPREVKDQLISMIGDSSPVVRKAVAEVAAALNDPGAVKALLAQLSVETDNDVRASTAAALGPAQDLKAVPPLLDLLDLQRNPSFRVAAAAARALADKDLSAKIRGAPPLGQQVGAVLEKAMNDTRHVPGAAGLRADVTRAIAALRDPRRLTLLLKLRSAGVDGNDVLVRRAAVQGLGLMDDAQARAGAAAALADSLRNTRTGEPDASVRLEAVIALGNVGSFADAAAPLYSRVTDPAEDASVKDQAWRALYSLFNSPDATADQLNRYVDNIQRDFPREPDRRRFPLLALKRKLTDTDALAAVNKDVAEVYLLTGRPEEAVAFAEQALNQRLSQNAPDVKLTPVILQLFQAYLQAKKYPDAARFAGERVKADRGGGPIQQVVGDEVVREIDRLIRANDARGALELVDFVKQNFNPPLAGRPAEEVEDRGRKLRKQLARP